MDQIQVEKLVKTIRNPNVNVRRKNHVKEKMVLAGVWDKEYEKFIHMTSTELYTLLEK